MIESLVRDGNKIIFATSFGFQNCMLSEAKKHPDVYFEQATGTLQAKNMAEYFGAGEDSIYLAGMAAGAATKKNLIGQVVAFPIPEVLRHASAFALGAQAVNPKAKLKLVFTNSWIDQAKDKKGAESAPRRRRRRARPERRLDRDRPVRAVGRRPVGRLQRRREEVRADVVADRRDLQLGRLLRAARQGGDRTAPGRPASTTGTSRTASPTSRPSGRR